MGPPLPPQPPSLRTASPVPPWPLDAQGGPWALRAPTFPSQWTPPPSRPSDSLLPWPSATPCLLAGGRLKVVLKPQGLECEGRSATGVWSSSSSSRSNRGQPRIAPPGTCSGLGESGPLLSLSLDLFFLHLHEEGSDLRAQDKSHPLAGRRPRVQGSGKAPLQPLTDPGMKGDGGAVWGLMWKYCISVRTLRYQGQGVEAALP